MHMIAVIGLAVCCAYAQAGGLSAADKQIILDEHNAIRARVANGQERDASGKTQPTAANMQKLVWDDEVARTAQDYIGSVCAMQHDPNNHKYGENIAAGSSGYYNFKQLVQMWESELTKSPGRLSYTPEAYQFGDGTGHYSQVVWAESSKLGCGTCTGNGMTYLLCRYSPAGNMMGGVMYKVGSKCSGCGSKQSCDNGMCTGAQDCVDKINDGYSCKGFKSSGYCDGGAYESYVRSNCAATCGAC